MWMKIFWYQCKEIREMQKWCWGAGNNYLWQFLLNQKTRNAQAYESPYVYMECCPHLKNLDMGEKQPLNGMPRNIIKLWRIAFHNLHSVVLHQIYGKWQMATIDEKVNLELIKFWSSTVSERKFTLHCQQIHSSLPTINLGNLGCKTCYYFSIFIRIMDLKP